MIVTDLKMPLGTGFDVLKHIRSKPEWAVVPTVVLSASSDTHDIQKSYLMGANAYLIKPSDTEELDSLLQVLHDFWIRVEVPQVHSDGDMKATEGEGKLGQDH